MYMEVLLNADIQKHISDLILNEPFTHVLVNESMSYITIQI